ncbi:MAG TPA: PA2779 family protein [Vicinamibacterales bacterium]|nr:PA2779 family protein [Vicinamibacterales bacterium]
MRIRATVSAFLFLCSVLVSSPAFAQQRHVVSPAEMRQAVAQQAQAQQQTRDSLRAVLKNSQVRDVANRLGLNVARAEGAVATLTAAELEQLAGPVQDLNANLAGGASTIVLSTTAILLIIIIIILLAN